MASFGCGALRAPGLYTQLSQALSFAPWGSGLKPVWPFPGCLAHGPVSHLPPSRQDTPSLSTFVPGSKGRRELVGLESTLGTSVLMTPHPSLPACYQTGWRERKEPSYLEQPLSYSVLAYLRQGN